MGEHFLSRHHVGFKKDAIKKNVKKEELEDISAEAEIYLRMEVQLLNSSSNSKS